MPEILLYPIQLRHLECKVRTPMIQEDILLEALVVIVDDGRAFMACGKLDAADHRSSWRSAFLALVRFFR